MLVFFVCINYIMTDFLNEADLKLTMSHVQVAKFDWLHVTMNFRLVTLHNENKLTEFIAEPV